MIERTKASDCDEEKRKDPAQKYFLILQTAKGLEPVIVSTNEDTPEAKFLASRLSEIRNELKKAQDVLQDSACKHGGARRSKSEMELLKKGTNIRIGHLKEERRILEGRPPLRPIEFSYNEQGEVVSWEQGATEGHEDKLEFWGIMGSNIETAERYLEVASEFPEALKWVEENFDLRCRLASAEATIIRIETYEFNQRYGEYLDSAGPRMEEALSPLMAAVSKAFSKS